MSDHSPRPEELVAPARAASSLKSRLYSSHRPAASLKPVSRPKGARVNRQPAGGREKAAGMAVSDPIRSGLTPLGMRPHPPTSGAGQTRRSAFPLRKRPLARAGTGSAAHAKTRRSPPVPPLPVTAVSSSVPLSLPLQRQRPETEEVPEKPNRMSLLQATDQFRTFTERLAEDPAYSEHMTHPSAFLYLSSVENNAYDLRIVDNKQIDPNDYYTLSSAGITRFTKGDSDFTSMQQFEREFYLYSMITQLPFFASYRVWKSFKEWKRAVRTRKVEERKARLEDQLFVLHPLLRTSLLQLRNLCYKAATFKLYHIDAESTYDLQVFCEQQAVQKREVERKLTRFADQVRALVAEACDRALRTFLQENGFTTHRSDGGMAGISGGGSTLLGMVQSSLADENGDVGGAGSSSMLQQQSSLGGGAARAITFTERAAMRTQCRKLTKYIRLADFFVVDTFLSLALSSTENFLRHISGRGGGVGGGTYGTLHLRSLQSVNKDGSVAARHEEAGGGDGKKKTKQGDSIARRTSVSQIGDKTRLPPSVPLFLVSMEVSGGGHGSMNASESTLSFSPTYDDFKMRMDMVLFDGLKVLFSPERLLTHPGFELYVQPAVDEHGLLGDGVDLEMMIVEDKHFQAVVEDINDCLEYAFDSAAEFSAVFSPFMDQFVTNEKLNATLNIQAYENAEISTFRALLVKYTAQQQSFASMPTVSDVGIIRINSEGLKGLFVPSPKRCLDEIHALIPMIMRKKHDVVYEEMKYKNERICKLPYSVDEFVELMSFLAETNASIDELENAYEFVSSLFDLCQEFRISMQARSSP